MAKKQGIPQTQPEADTTETDTIDSAPRYNKLVTLLGGIILVILFGLSWLFFYRLGVSKSPVKPTPTPIATISSEPTETLSVSPTSGNEVPSVSPTSTPTNTPTNTPTSTPTPQADLYISEYSFNHPPKSGEAFTVKIGLYNKGNAKAGGFWWEWWATSAIRPCRVRVPDGLVAHGGIIVTCPYTYPSWSTYTTKAIIDADNEVSESDEGNNTYTQNVIPIH